MDLQRLLNKEFIWRACDLTEPAGSPSITAIPTGFVELDSLLHGRGWPRDAVVEMLIEVHGRGELRLLIPGLRHLIREEKRWVAWINPPFVPYAPALHDVGIDVNRILLVYPNNHREALWALEKVLESGSCSAILAWLDEQVLEEKQLRRLQARAKVGRVWTTIFRPAVAAIRPSPAELRIRMEGIQRNEGNSAVLSILKRRGGWSVNGVLVKLQWHPDALPTDDMTQRWNFWKQERKEIREGVV